MARCRLHDVENCALCKAARGNAERGPFVNGRLIQIGGIMAEREDNYREIRTWQLKPEIFDAYESDVMKAAREAGADAERLGYRLDVQHVINVTGPPDTWQIEKHGRSMPQDVARGGLVVGIPSDGMREAVLDRYCRVKLTGQPIYDAVQTHDGRNYRRLLWPVTDHRDYVTRIVSSIVSESIAAA